MDKEDEGSSPPEEPTPPPREEIRIRDLSSGPGRCSACGKEKDPYVEITVDGVLEYTCKECYEGEVFELAACRQCGAAIEVNDRFCGKCGTSRAMNCPSCGAEASDGDRFCGKCGAALT